MKTFLNCIFWIVLVGCIALPLAFSVSFKDYTINVTTMLSGLCGLITLLVAIRLYDKYGVESKAKERNMKAVEDAIAELQKVDFIINYQAENKDGETPINYVISLTFQSNKEQITKYLSPEALSSLLYYKGSGMYGCLQVSENIRSNLFLPTNIVDAATKLAVFKYEPQNIDTEKRPLTTLSASSVKIRALDGPDYNLPEQHLTVIQFIDAYFEIKESILGWYKSQGIETRELNFG